MKVDLIIGSRQEFIKLAPVARIMRNYPGVDPRIILTDQHTDLLNGLPEFFSLEIHTILKVMAEGQSLAVFTSKLLLALEKTIPGRQTRCCSCSRWHNLSIHRCIGRLLQWYSGLSC